MKCARCDFPESRVNGFCSTDCERLAEVEEERDEARAEVERLRGWLFYIRERTIWSPESALVAFWSKRALEVGRPVPGSEQ